MLEEAKRRDHRKIGAEMGLFAMDTEYVGPGLPLWLPKGHGDCGGTGKAGQGNGIRRRLRARENAAHRQGENVSDERASADSLRGFHVSADGTARWTNDARTSNAGLEQFERNQAKESMNASKIKYRMFRRTAIEELQRFNAGSNSEDATSNENREAKSTAFEIQKHRR